MDKIRKMREKQKKKKIATYISNKIMNLAKNLENNMHGKKSLEISDEFEGNIIYDNGLFNILNSQKISKFKKKPKKIEFINGN